MQIIKIKKVKLSFLIPAYNEEKLLEYGTKVYKNYLAGLVRKNKNFDYEIILCLNGCTDSTEKVAKKLHINRRIRYVTSEKGFGNGLNKGILAARGNIITFGNADAELLPTFIEPALKLMEENDFVLGSRYLANQGHGSSFLRKFYSHVFRFMFRLNFLFKFSEVGVIKMFNADWGKKFAAISRETNFDWQVEVDAHAILTGLKCAEVKVDYKQIRDASESKVGIVKDTIKYLRAFGRYGPKVYLHKLGLY